MLTNLSVVLAVAVLELMQGHTEMELLELLIQAVVEVVVVEVHTLLAVLVVRVL
jgi:hypothetical protein